MKMLSDIYCKSSMVDSGKTLKSKIGRSIKFRNNNVLIHNKLFF